MLKQIGAFFKEIKNNAAKKVRVYGVCKSKYCKKQRANCGVIR